MTRLLALCCCCLLCSASEYLSEAEAALRSGDQQRAARLLHFARAAGTLELSERLWVNGRLAALRLRLTGEQEKTAAAPSQRWHIERVLLGEQMNVDDWRAYTTVLAQAPDDPLLRRFHEELLPDWVVANGHDEHGPWLALACGVRLMRFRIIPVGTVHCDDGRQLRLRDNILIAETPCTLGQWHGLFPDAELVGGDLDLPYSGLSADELVAAVAALDRRFPQVRIRLPTANEWEFAARGLSGAHDLVPQLQRELADFDRMDPQPVRRHQGNGFGLFDVQGGIWELCQESDGGLARRGGSWRSRAAHCALALQLPVLHQEGDPTLGFRLVIEP